jgi:hypothetical protein
MRLSAPDTAVPSIRSSYAMVNVAFWWVQCARPRCRGMVAYLNYTLTAALAQAEALGIGRILSSLQKMTLQSGLNVADQYLHCQDRASVIRKPGFPAH